MSSAELRSAEVPVLAVRGLVAGYGRGTPPVLHGIDLQIAPGETLGLVGESGSGKTTLSRALFGLVKPIAGRVELFGRDIAALGRSERHATQRAAQMVFQDPYSSLDPSMTIADTIAEPLIVHRVGDRAIRNARIFELLDLVKLHPSVAARYPTHLSGGQRQRVAIARALSASPRLLVCDEPVSALDVSVQAQILNLLKRLKLEFGLSMLFITHDLAVVRFIADRVAVIQDGRIVEQGARSMIFDSPGHPYTRELLAASATREERNVPPVSFPA